MVKEKVIYSPSDSIKQHNAIMYEVFVDSSCMIYDEYDSTWKRVGLINITPDTEQLKMLNE